jgi:hypothetical protein
MTTPVERILEKLRDAKQAGKGWSARCPAHDDRRASLSIGKGNDGRALVHCHAGCKPDAICAAVGLTVLDLMPTADMLPMSGKATNGKRAVKTFTTARDAVAELERRHGPRSALWTYRDASREPVGVVVRWDRADGGKDIRPASRYADGWRIEGMPEPRPLYGLPDLASARRVYVCEGEKAADALRSIGLTATTSAHGAQAADKTDWRPLAGKEVILWPDNDPAGRKYIESVRALLAKLTPAPAMKLLEVNGLPAGGDAADFVAAHVERGRA